MSHHDDSGSSSSDEERTYEPPNPFALKERGSEAYKRGAYSEAIELYKLALKEALKKSVRAPCKELVDLQMHCRLNLALAFYKEEDYVMAKEHLMVVLEQRPDFIKVYYRLGEVYLALQDYEKAKEIVQVGLKLFENDVALTQLLRRIQCATIEYRKQQRAAIKERVNLKNIDDERTNKRQDVPLFDPKPFESLWQQTAETAETSSAELIDKLCKSLIDWRHSTHKLMPNETHEDIDDHNSKNWTFPHSPTRLSDDKTVLYMSLPLSILALIENCIRLTHNPLQRTALEVAPPEAAGAAAAAADATAPRRPLPSLPHCPTPRYELSLRQHAVQWASRLSSHTTKSRPLTIHVLGARGDVEMECKWASMLDRLPHVDLLQVCMIGFVDSNDPYSRRLRGDDYFSPPLTKKSGYRLFQKFTARLYKGSYQQFLSSKSVEASVEGSDGGSTTKFASIDLPLGPPNKSISLSPILSAPNHPLHPDLIVIPEPNLSRWFDQWVPAIAHILLANIPLAIFGYSVMEGDTPSHEALNLVSILEALGARFVQPLRWNPYSIPINPGEDCPPMPILTINGEEAEFKGVSGKNAVSLMVCGINSSSAEEAESIRCLLADLMLSPAAVHKLREDLSRKGIDTQRERLILESSGDYFEQMALEAQQREKEIEQKAKDLAEILKDKLSDNNKNNLPASSV